MNFKYVFKVTQERLMEWLTHLWYKFRGSGAYKSKLVEVYKIKKRFMDEDFVKEFLKERKKAVAPGRYRIEIVTDETPGDDETIGSVTLMRKKKVIDKATLVTKKYDRESEKLIYWKF